jgi:mono/diheme cytochrome c family protein
VARLCLLAALVLLAAGCSDSVPGVKVVAPTPVTVIGKLSTPWSGGNAAAGLKVFESAGCSACHTFTPAHATGKVGPDLDKLPQYATAANQGPLPEYIYNFVTSPNGRVVAGFPPNVMPATFATTLSAKQLADLVAFLAKGP